MELVNSLGEDRLWVDSLCTVQDDAELKHHQISHMAIIYSGALVTLVAAGARDANSSIPGVRAGTRWLREKQKVPELNCPLRPDLVFKAIDRTVYVSRAWTFQERHLSRRCLYFLDEQVYFQCRKELWCEEPSPLALARFNLGSPLGFGLNLMPRAQAWAEDIRRKDYDRGFAFYAEIIQEYSWKSLSYPKDIMNAFAGILNALETHSSWNITYGMLEELIDWTLLWVPLGVQQRRPSPQSGSLLHFPSWSWIGWIGPITFNLAFNNFALAPLQSLIEDIDVDLRSLRRKIVGKSGNVWIPVSESKLADHPLPTPSMFPSILRFTIEIINTTNFEIEEMPHWRWNPTEYSDKGTSSEQTGIFITRNGKVTGLLLGTSAKFAPFRNWSHLRLVAISEARQSVSGIYSSILLPGEMENMARQSWTDYQQLAYKHEAHRFDYPTGYFMYNVMVIQRRGDYYERVAVGQMNRLSWKAGIPVKETILLV